MIMTDTYAGTLLRGAVRAYTWYFPYSRGKRRLIRLFHRFSAAPRRPLRTRLRGGLLVDLNVQEAVQRECYYFGAYEPGIISIWQRLIRKGMVVVDCGAHIGQYTLYGARAVGTTGQVYAFEPTPDTFKTLAHNVELNKLKNIQLVNAALADTLSGKQEFYLRKDTNQGANSLAPTSATSELASFTVETTTLDTHFAASEQLPGVIKLDVEGAELLALRGAVRVIEAAHPWLILEASEKHLQAFGHSLSQLRDFLDEQGYSLYRIEANGKVAPVGEVLAAHQNLLCVPPGASISQTGIQLSTPGTLMNFH
jgi:FkbM family methyltransferase